MNKKEREAFFNELQAYLPEKVFLTFMKVMLQIEKELSELREKLYSVDFAKKRVKKFYLNNQPFTKFLINLMGEAC